LSGATISGTPSAVGTYNFTIQAMDTGAPPQTVTQPYTVIITSGAPNPTITSNPAPGGTKGTPYSFPFTASGGTPPYTWSISAGSPPAGLSINAATGVLSGTPTTTGTSGFTVKVTDSLSNSGTQVQSVTIVAPSLNITSPVPQNGTVSVAYGPLNFMASGGVPPYSWTVAASTPLPTGLALSGPGVLSGIPTVAGTYPVTITVQDSEATPLMATGNYTIVIQTFAAGGVSLPTSWVNPHEFDNDLANPVVTKHIINPSGGDYPYTCAGIQNALTDWAAAADQAWVVNIDPGTVPAGTNVCLQLTPKAVGAGLPTHFIILQSSNPPTRNQVICAHGLGPDTPAGGSVRNLGCSSPNDAANLWYIETSTINQEVISTTDNSGNPLLDINGNGPSHIVLRDFQASPTTAVTTFNAVARIGTLASETSAAQLPSHVHLQYFYIHGDAGDTFTPGTPPGNNLLANDLTFSCVYCSLSWFYTDKSTRPGSEGHGIAIGNNVGPIRITNFWMEGMSSGIFHGGNTPGISGIVSTNDEEDRVGTLTYPVAWLGANWGSGHSPVRKNGLEFKEGARALVDGLVVENVDQTGGQGAPCISVTVRACSAGTACDNYAAVLHDLTVSNSIFRQCLGVQQDSRSGGSGAGVSSSFGGYNIQFVNNLFYNGPGATYCVGGGACTPYRWPGQASEHSTWTCSASRSGVNGNITLTCADGGTGLHETDILVGDPLSVSNCTDSTFNTGTTAIGALALTGTISSGLTVVYNNLSTGATSTTGCSLQTSQGYWNNLQWLHNTFVVSSGTAVSTTMFGITSCPPATTITPYPRNQVIQNNLWGMDGWAGWVANGSAEGSSGAKPSESCWDKTTLTFNHNVIAERPQGNYTEYPAGIVGGQPGSTLYFPTTPQCSSTTPNTACIGFSGMLSGTFNQAPADFHAFELCGGSGSPAGCAGSSVFAAGQSQQASDGLDMGANIPQIDAHMTMNMYPGGFPTQGKVIIVDPSGNDSNPGTANQPVATLTGARTKIAGTAGSLAAFNAGFYPQTQAAFSSADSGSSSLPITYRGAGTASATDNTGATSTILSGGIVLSPANGYTWTVNGSGPSCSPSCTEYDVNILASTFSSNQIEALYYNGVRRYRPTSPYQSYYTQGSPDGSHLVTFSATQSTFFPIQGNAPSSNFECYACYRRDPSDTRTTFHGLSPTGTCSATGAVGATISCTGVHDVEIMAFERWTGARMRLSAGNSDTINSFTLSSTNLPVTGLTTGAPPNFGPYAGQRYILDNVFEAFSHAQQWYLDRCPTHSDCSAGVESTWVLRYLAAAGENPNTDQVVVPLLTTMVTANTASNISFVNLTFSHDAFTIAAAGQPGISDASNIPAANSFVNSTGISLQNDIFTHFMHWAWEFTGSPSAQTAYTNFITNTTSFDLGTGNFRLGKTETASDTSTNVEQFASVQNAIAAGGQRFLPGGVGLAFWIGNAHDNLVSNISCYDWYSGCVGVGGSQGYNGLGHVVATNNTVQFADMHDIGQGVTSDDACVHWHSGLSTGNVLQNFICHDVNQDPTSNTFWSGYNGIGIYIDNSSSNITVKNGLVYRVSQATSLTNSATDGLGQNNTWNNVILGYGRLGCLMKAGDTSVFQVLYEHLICYGDKWNSHNGPQFEGGSSWITPVTNWNLTNNTYFNFVNSLGTGSPFYQTVSMARQYKTFLQWQALGVDTTSTDTVNPNFVGPSFSQGDNYNFASTPPSTYTVWDLTQPGAKGLLFPPAVPEAFPLQNTLNKNTDY